MPLADASYLARRRLAIRVVACRRLQFVGLARARAALGEYQAAAAANDLLGARSALLKLVRARMMCRILGRTGQGPGIDGQLQRCLLCVHAAPTSSTAAIPTWSAR